MGQVGDGPCKDITTVSSRSTLSARRDPYLHGIGHVVIRCVVDSGEEVLTQLQQTRREVDRAAHSLHNAVRAIPAVGGTQGARILPGTPEIGAQQSRQEERGSLACGQAAVPPLVPRSLISVLTQTLTQTQTLVNI